MLWYITLSLTVYVRILSLTVYVSKDSKSKKKIGFESQEKQLLDYVFPWKRIWKPRKKRKERDLPSRRKEEWGRMRVYGFACKLKEEWGSMDLHRRNDDASWW